MSQSHPAQWDDEELLTAYRRTASTVDGAPDYVLAAAKAAFLTRDIEGEIAVLIADSRADDQSLYEPIRAEPDPAQGRWQLSFRVGGIQVDLEITEQEGRLGLIGLLSGRSEEH